MNHPAHLQRFLTLFDAWTETDSWGGDAFEAMMAARENLAQAHHIDTARLAPAPLADLVSRIAAHLNSQEDITEALDKFGIEATPEQCIRAAIGAIENMATTYLRHL